MGLAPSPIDLAALIGSVGTTRFFAEYWEKKALHVRRGEATFYDGVLSNEALDRLISSADLRFPAIQLARHGGYFAPEVYTRTFKHGTEVWSGVPDLEKIQSEYRAGATIVLPALHRTWAPLRELCAAMERTLSHAVHANAYLTAGNATGFSAHYDTHEVFVLQIGGSKQWRVYPPPTPLPHRTQPFHGAAHTAPAAVSEIALRAGDLLYLPRGFVHAAATSEDHSAHVTIGVTVYTWVDLLAEWAAAAKEVPAMREALPVGFAHDDEAHASLVKGLLDRVDALRAGSPHSDAVAAFRRQVRSNQPRPPVAFRSAMRVIGRATELVVASAERYAIDAENGRVTLQVDGRMLALPAEVGPTLAAICARGAFRFGDLPMPLGESATLAFVRFLEAEGLLTQAPARGD